MAVAGPRAVGKSQEIWLMYVLYASVIVLLSLVLVGSLSGPILNALPEEDLWWMLPTMSHYVGGRSLGEALWFLFSPGPLELGQPVLKMYLSLFLLSGSGLYTAHIILVSLGLHLINALLLYWLCWQLELSRRVCIVSSAIFLTLFAHFQAYMWPPAAQHLIAIFTILLMLNLYVFSEKREERGAPYTTPFIATWALALFASLQRSALIAPAVILTHILMHSRDADERIARYERWLPVFVSYLVYPSFALTMVGDPKLPSALLNMPLPPIGNALVVFTAATGGLLLLRLFVRLIPRCRSGWLIGGGMTLAAMVWVVMVVIVKDHRQLLWPYNIFVPFAATLSSFLDPLQVALLVDSTEPYHNIPPQVSVFSIGLSLVLLAVFVAAFVKNRKYLIIFVAWYLLCLGYFLGPNVAFTVRIPSRYFIYVSPVFAVILATTLVALLDVLLKNTRLTQVSRNALLAGLLVALCLPNVMAIRVEVFRGKLANTYLIYDYIRAARLIQGDLERSGPSRQLKAGDIYVMNMLPMPVRQFWDFARFDGTRYETFRDILAEVFRDKRKWGIQVNAAPASASSAVYVVSDHRIRNDQGNDIEPFARLFDAAVTEMNRNRHQEAMQLLRLAVEERPFLLRYVLGSNPLEDLRWVTNGLDMRHWINRLAASHRAWSYLPIAKNEHIAAVMNAEVSDYTLSMFYLAYLEERSGRPKQASRWLSRIRFLERDPETLSSWIGKVPAVLVDRTMTEFLGRLKDPAYFRNPQPWQFDDYGFARFLVRLLFGLRLPSGWERQQSAGM